MSRIITVTSGKGGVGKSNLTVNLALYLASRDYRVCLFDADIGLANIDILLGLYPEHTLEDVLAGRKKIKDIIISDYSGMDIIPGGSGIKKLADPESGEIEFLINALTELESYDFIFFDTSAGISKNVVSFCMASPEIILVITPEPTSLTDAYSLLKILSFNGFKNSVMVAINQCSNIELAGDIFTKFKKVVHKYLSIKILPLGTIPSDPRVAESVKAQKPFISRFPAADASRGVKNIARHLISKDVENIDEYDLKKFWPKCFELLEGSLQLTNKRLETDPPGRKEDRAAVKKKQEEKAEGDGTLLTKIADKRIPDENGGNSLDSMQRPLPLDLNPVLENIAKGISSISSELGAIRKYIEMMAK